MRITDATRTTIAQHPCQFCAECIEMEVDLGESFVDMPSECPHCGVLISNELQSHIAGKVITDALGSAIDQATDRDR